MIGLDANSIQVFIYLDPVLIYISLWIDCLFEIRRIVVCFLLRSLRAIAGSLMRLYYGCWQFRITHRLWTHKNTLGRLHYFLLIPRSLFSYFCALAVLLSCETGPNNVEFSMKSVKDVLNVGHFEFVTSILYIFWRFSARRHWYWVWCQLGIEYQPPY